MICIWKAFIENVVHFYFFEFLEKWQIVVRIFVTFSSAVNCVIKGKQFVTALRESSLQKAMSNELTSSAKK